MSRPRLLFVSPRFLFPLDQGGKIRTANILRQMKGGYQNEVLDVSTGPLRLVLRTQPRSVPAIFHALCA